MILLALLLSPLVQALADLKAMDHYSNQEIDIFTLEIPGLHNKDGQGAYDVIIKKVVARHFNLDIQPLPPKRAIKYFKSCRHCCFTPGNKDPNFYTFDQSVISTVPMNVAKIVIVSPYGIKPYHHLSQLTGKEVGIRTGMPLSQNIITAIKEKKFNVQRAKSIKANLGRLELGRVEAVLAWFPDIELLFEQQDIKPYPYDPSYPVAVHHDNLVCRGVPDNFFAVFNAGVKSLRASGELEKIIGKSYVKPSPVK